MSNSASCAPTYRTTAYIPPHLRNGPPPRGSKSLTSYGIFAFHADGRVLAIEHFKEDWTQITFSKGRRRKNERVQTPDGMRAVAERELMQETGLRIVRYVGDRDVPVTQEYDYETVRNSIAKTVHFFTAVVTGVPVPDPRQVHRCMWLTREELLEVLTHGEDRDLARRVFESL